MIIKDAAGQAEFNPTKMGKADLTRGRYLFAGLNAFEPGQEHEPHSHCDRDKIYFVLRGEGEVTVGEETSRVVPGDMALAPSGVVHSVRNTGAARLVLLVVMGPPPGSPEPACSGGS